MGSGQGQWPNAPTHQCTHIHSRTSDSRGRAHTDGPPHTLSFESLSPNNWIPKPGFSIILPASSRRDRRRQRVDQACLLEDPHWGLQCFSTRKQSGSSEFFHPLSQDAKMSEMHKGSVTEGHKLTPCPYTSCKGWGVRSCLWEEGLTWACHILPLGWRWGEAQP